MANVAFEWLLASVGSHVVIQSVFLFEAVSALWALERAVSSVHAFVLFQGSLPIRTIHTQ